MANVVANLRFCPEIVTKHLCAGENVPCPIRSFASWTGQRKSGRNMILRTIENDSMVSFVCWVHQSICADRVKFAERLFVMFPVLVATLHSNDAGAEAATMRRALQRKKLQSSIVQALNACMLQSTPQQQCAGLFACAVAVDMRLKYGFSKYLTWLVAIPAGLTRAHESCLYN